MWLLLLLLLAPMEESAPAVVRVGAITVVSQDVFSPEEAENGSFYRLANAIHVSTRESFLRNQLLFREGDVLNIEMLAETERNLRALPFIKSASVTAAPPRNGVADVTIITQDAWTTQPSVSIGSKGAKTTYSFEFQETDFLGTGRSVVVSYDQLSDRISRYFQIQDPFLFRPFWKGQAIYADNSDGSQRRLEVARPFFSFEAPWSVDADYQRLSETEKTYADGRTFSTFRNRHREDLLSYGRAIEATTASARRWTAGLNFVDNEFSALPPHPAPLLPADRKFRYLFAEYESVGNSFVTLNYVNRDSRYEDFNLAPRLFARAAWSSRALGAPVNSAFGSVEASGGVDISDLSFAQADISAESRFEGGLRNSILSGFVGFVRKFEGGRPMTFVGRIQADRGWRLDEDVQFAADGATGLRGYRLHAMTGNKRVLLNLEQRFFSEREFLQLVEPGAVVFVDAGTAAPPGTPLRLSGLRADVGAGLRFAIARAGSNNVLRVDLAYAIRPDPQGRGRLIVSFSSAQAFSFQRVSPSGE